jgi:hypothetical protein
MEKITNSEDKLSILNKILTRRGRDDITIPILRESIQLERTFFIKSNFITVGIASLAPLTMLFFAESIVQYTVIIITVLAYIGVSIRFKKEIKIYDFTDEELEAFIKENTK